MSPMLLKVFPVISGIIWLLFAIHFSLLLYLSDDMSISRLLVCMLCIIFSIASSKRKKTAMKFLLAIFCFAFLLSLVLYSKFSEIDGVIIAFKEKIRLTGILFFIMSIYGSLYYLYLRPENKNRSDSSSGDGDPVEVSNN